MNGSLPLITWLALAGLAASAVLMAQEAVAPDDEQVFRVELEVLNRQFNDLHTGFVPVEQGAVTILMRSPRHRIQVHSHRLTVRTVSAAPSGTFDVWLTVELDGDGDLEATIQETGTEFQDRVVAPRQTLRVASRMRLVADQGGFHLEIVKPYLQTIDFQIQSELAGRIVSSCMSLRFLLGGMDCDALEAAMSVAKVAMPAPGERFWLPDENLSETDRALLRTWAGLAAD